MNSTEMDYVEKEIDGQVRHCPKCEKPYVYGAHFRDGTTVFNLGKVVTCFWVGEGDSVQEGSRMVFFHEIKEEDDG